MKNMVAQKLSPLEFLNLLDDAEQGVEDEEVADWIFMVMDAMRALIEPRLDPNNDTPMKDLIRQAYELLPESA